MNKDEAKAILLLYRGEVDAQEAQFADALDAAARDPELARWLQDHVATYQALRQRLKEMPVPAGLSEKILRHRPRLWWQSPVLKLAASIVVLLGLAAFWIQRASRQNTFEDYRRFTARVVMGKYRMSIETDDPARVRRFLDNNQAPADYVLPAALQRQPLRGGTTLSWDGHPVSLLCFRRAISSSGIDTWLFITNEAALPTASDSPQFAAVDQIGTVAWRRAGKVYLLATRGDAEQLRPLLE